jgi:hypothetical protein
VLIVVYVFFSLAKSVLLTSHKNKPEHNIREGNILYKIIQDTKMSAGYLITKQYATWGEISTFEFQKVMFIFSRKLTTKIDINLMAF